MIVIGGDQSISSLKAGDIGDLRVRQFKGILDTHSFIIFQVQDDLRLGVIDDALPVFSTFQRKEVCQVLGRSNRRAAISTDDLKDFQAELSGHRVATGADQLPNLIYEDGLLLRSILLRLVPDVVECDKHTDDKQVASELRDIEDRVGIRQVHVGRLVEGLRGAMHQAVQDVAEAFCLRRLDQQIIDILKQRHLPVLGGIVRVDQGLIVMRDPLERVCSDQRFVQQLLLLMAHVWDQKRKKDMELLNFLGQNGVFIDDSVNDRVGCLINTPDLHDVDALPGCRTDRDELASDILAGSEELMALQRSDDEYLGASTPHP